MSILKLNIHGCVWVSKLHFYGLRLICPLPPLSTTILRHNVTQHHHSHNSLLGMARLGKEGARPCFTSGDGCEKTHGPRFLWEKGHVWLRMDGSRCVGIDVSWKLVYNSFPPPFTTIYQHQKNQTTIPVTTYMIQKAHL